MKLGRNEFCPIHRSLFCCGREQAQKERRSRLGVQRIEDPHHPRGYRELRSPAEMRKLLNRKIVEQGGKCAICHEDFSDCSEVVPDHICRLNYIFAARKPYLCRRTVCKPFISRRSVPNRLTTVNHKVAGNAEQVMGRTVLIQALRSTRCRRDETIGAV